MLLGGYCSVKVIVSAAVAVVAVLVLVAQYIKADRPNQT